MADLKARIIINVQDNASSAFKSLESSVSAVKDRINQFMGLQLTSYFSNMIGSVKDAAESYQTLNARLKLIVTDSEEYKKAQTELFDIAQRSRGGLKETIDLYTGIAEKIKDMGGSSKETAAVVETVNKAIALTSMGIQQDSAALLQFKQGINGATYAGDELKSTMENSPGLARAMAEGMGVTVGALKKLGTEGKITAVEVVNAMIKMQGSVDEKFNQIPLTIGQAITSVNNSWTQYIGKANEASNTTSKVANVIKASGDNLPEIISGLTTLGELYGVALVSKLGAFIGKTVESTVAKNAATAATEKVVLAETELIAAMQAGGTQTTRYQLAQEQLTVAMQEGGAVTQSMSGKQAALISAQQAVTASTTRLELAQTALYDALLTGGAAAERYAEAQAAETLAKNNAQLATQKLTTAQANLNAEIAASGATSQRAIVLAEELNVATLAQTAAKRELAIAQVELNNAMTAGGANTVRYAAANTALISAQNAATASTAKLETATAALGVTTEATKASMLTLGNGFNVLLAAYAGWEIGTFLNKFEAVRLAGLGAAEMFVKTTEATRYFFSGEFLKADNGTFSKKMAEISKSFDELALATLDSTKSSNEAVKNQGELLKAQAIAVQASFKQTQDTLKETTKLLDDRYKNEKTLIDQNLKVKIESLNTAGKTESQKIKEITDLTVAANKTLSISNEDLTDEKLQLTDKVYQDAIAKTKEGTVQRKEIESQYADATKEIYQSSLENYKSTIDSMISAAQSHRDKALGFANDILNAEQRKSDGILQLERIGMNDAQLKASKKKEIELGLSEYKKAMADGDFKMAQEISKQNEKLVLDLASTEKTQSSEVSKLKSEYIKVIGQTEEATKGLQKSEEEQATALETNAKTQIEKMAGLQTEINNIDSAISKEHMLKIGVNDSEIQNAINEINNIPHDVTTTVHVKTIQENSNGGQIQYFADGGQPQYNFQRREGGLGGYGGGDTVPAMLEPGEWIIKKESVQKYGNGFMAKLNAGQIQDLPHFARGGFFSGASSKSETQTDTSADEKELNRLVDDYNKRSARGALDISDYGYTLPRIDELKSRISAAKAKQSAAPSSSKTQSSSKNASAQPSKQNEEITINFKFQNGASAKANATPVDAKTIVDALRDAANRGISI